jgi:DNA recombination protein RmuC
MGLSEILCLVILAAVALLGALILSAVKKNGTEKLEKEIETLRADVQRQLTENRDALSDEMRRSREEMNAAVRESMRAVGETLSAVQRQATETQDTRLRELVESVVRSQEMLQKVVSERLGQVEEKFREFTAQDKESLESVRQTMQTRLEAMQQDNAKQLDRMRETVDEKLQKTLDDRITQSFKLVNERLQEVYAGLGEMKTLATGVGDLKKVLSNVKTRGIMGEIQLGAIMEEILPREQYEENVATVPGSTNRVEYAVRLPGGDAGTVYMPVDAKFPADIYHQLVDAYDSGDPAAIQTAAALLDARIKGCAKDIRDKYIDPPYTTDFGIMFLPFEGLYAEVVRRGLADQVQRLYKVSIAGPTTFAALLNSLQMGFRTLAIQKRSSEVWTVLGAVKTEFNTFGEVLSKAQQRIEQTSAELDKLVGVRTRKINSRLRGVSELPAAEAAGLLESADASEDGE